MKTIEVTESVSMDASEVYALCRRARQVLVNDETKAKYPTGPDAIDADPIAPVAPATRAAATPHILLVGPFQDEPALVAVAFYVGIGFIEVRDEQGGLQSYAFRSIGGDGFEARLAFLQAAFRLFFDNVQVLTKATS